MTVSPSVGIRHATGPESAGDSDASVIERSWAEPDAFAGLFERYADDIHRYVARRLGADVADDLMAETFVIAFQRRRCYDLSQPHARPWLYGIATNLVGRHRRTEARRLRALSRVTSLVADEGDDGEPLADRIADKVSAESSRAALAGALGRLPARHRDVFLVITCGDLDYKEAAQALGIPVGTVRSRLHRARSKLRQALSASHPAVLHDAHKETDHG
ncbi:RNA polymerase sigma factor [Streptomyces sp. NPDC001530]|uniref:RNA polymerase sigma factor n=1 Tax=Streptomyces sp. NPDC001530 TaxID=3364582 RepID=UPI0036841D5A